MTFDPTEWGTVAAWVTGLLAVVFAALAWRQARQATYWAKHATRAEQRANYLFEMSRPVKVKMSLQQATGGRPDRIPRTIADSVFVVELSDDSDPVWVQDIVIWSAVLAEDDGTGNGPPLVEELNVEHRPTELHWDVPFLMRPGERIEEVNPWDGDLAGRYLDQSNSFADGSFRYSFHPDAGYKRPAERASMTDKERTKADAGLPTVHEVFAPLDLSAFTRPEIA
jgi:hypothetical protein